MPIKKYIEENFKNTWTKDIFSKSTGKRARAIFINRSTNTLFASENYSMDLIKDFIEDTIKKSMGKVNHFETLTQDEYNKKYKEMKYIDQLALYIVQEK